MVKRIFVTVVSALPALLSFSQNFPEDEFHTMIQTDINVPDSVSAGKEMLLSSREKRKRIWLTTGTHAAYYAGSLSALSEAWFVDYPKTGFHVTNDSKAWNQVDKAGHAWSAYNLSKYSTAMWKWTGLSRKKAILSGCATGLTYMTVIELLDAHSAGWGWSWGDMAANIIGTGLFTGQELAWKEQRIQYKLSVHANHYREPMLKRRADELFGKNWSEKVLEDYNAQTYWLSVNIKSFSPKTKLPAWLNLAVGYGADNLYGAYINMDTDDASRFDRRDLPRKRQFYLAPDIDFTKIPVKSKFLKTTFFFLNALKCPAPALMIDSKGKFKGYAVYF